MFDRAEAVRALVDGGFAGMRVLVVGDVMLDRYLVGDVGRISPEAPVPVVRLSHETMGVGGAGNVALNLAGLGVSPVLVGWTGDDPQREHLMRMLRDAGVDTSSLTPIPGRPTTTKTRVLSRRQQLVRIDDEDVSPLPPSQRAVFDAMVEELLADGYHAVVISDYAKGVVTAELCRVLVRRARALSVPVLADPKGTDFSRYTGATTVTPNEHELAAAYRVPAHDADALVGTAVRVRAELELDFLTLTRGEAGMSLVEPDGVHHVPANAQEVFDVAGAGDTAIATLAAGLAAGLGRRDAAALANLAAGVIVAKTGTVPIHRSDLRAALEAALGRAGRSPASKIGDLATVNDAVARWRAEGATIGFTNGCFDLLHPGHVTGLDFARRHCDRLVVAINSDESGRALKGDGRPLMDERARATVLAGLAAVDAVVIFSDPTPLHLITVLRPDVLVKGDDYRVEDVVGGAEARSWGGRVLLAPTIDGQSTTAIVERLRRSNAATRD